VVGLFAFWGRVRAYAELGGPVVGGGLPREGRRRRWSPAYSVGVVGSVRASWLIGVLAAPLPVGEHSGKPGDTGSSSRCRGWSGAEDGDVSQSSHWSDPGVCYQPSLRSAAFCDFL